MDTQRIQDPEDYRKQRITWGGRKDTREKEGPDIRTSRGRKGPERRPGMAMRGVNNAIYDGRCRHVARGSEQVAEVDGG